MRTGFQRIIYSNYSLNQVMIPKRGATDGPRRWPACRRSRCISFKEQQIPIFCLWSPRNSVHSR